ncbi:molybdenum cofactor guanylyltransferase MobA [Methylophaga sp. OBS4]|uniref:molybdenum cofactor guanylyltransferase MobA n=1 Tax=Methylophaga sp. OBS4 TaxID=2991935 RepID=UPI00224ED96E|nr:molybdenum cofactor guanylyltransferase MobA [Methylophaga sp. OBS4]MCX4188052.1 molybdenum cofactor guanylyltransferase [Methylophaga sp. OBS4]
MNIQPYPSVTGVILAGGQARRMGGEDKGLLHYQHKPMVSYAIEAMRPQVDTLIINANRNIDQYQMFGYPVVSDSIEGFHGPLAGMLTAMENTDSDYILTAPCDSPSITPNLRQRMMETLLLSHSEVAVASDGDRMQPVFCLIPCRLKQDLKHFLQQGERKIDRWLAQYKLAEVDFSDQLHTFINCNHPEDLQQINPIKAPLPMIGFSAFSGTGKTTLLTQLLPKLTQRGIRVAVIKHAHHNFDIDKPGKDSYEIREAGAQQMLIASAKMMALIEKNSGDDKDPNLAELLPRLDHSQLDLILVEGFKHEVFPKIELHRPSLGKPLLFKDDPYIIAIASDSQLAETATIDRLDLNDIDAIADYIELFMNTGTA